MEDCPAKRNEIEMTFYAIDNLKVPVACLMCVHFNKIEMNKVLKSIKTKNNLRSNSRESIRI